MPSRGRNIGRVVFSILLCAGAGQSLLAADLSTLFTTPQERQIINSNRYKSDKPKLVEIAEPVEETIELPIQPLVQEEVIQQYVISGITLSRDGPHSVWINSIMYEDGERLDDNSRVKVLAGDEVMVRITAPNGKQYYATSGQTLEVSYMVDVEN
jgi:hypothetical protein